MNNQEIEKLENKYLNKFYHFLKSFEDEMMAGFQTKEKIKDDQLKSLKKEVEDKIIALGAEPITKKKELPVDEEIKALQNQLTELENLQDENQIEEQDLIAFTREHLAGYKLPKQVLFVPEVMRAPNGKANYKWAKETAEKELG